MLEDVGFSVADFTQAIRDGNQDVLDEIASATDLSTVDTARSIDARIFDVVTGGLFSDGEELDIDAADSVNRVVREAQDALREAQAIPQSALEEGFFGSITPGEFDVPVEFTVNEQEAIEDIGRIEAAVALFGDTAVQSFGSAADILAGLGDGEGLTEFRARLAEQTRLAAEFPALLEEAAGRGLSNVVATALEAGALEGSQLLSDVLNNSEAVEIDADIGEFNSKVAEADDALNTLSEQIANPLVDPETGEALNELAAVDGELDNLSEKTARPTVDLDLGDSLAVADIFERRVDELTRNRTINIGFNDPTLPNIGFAYGGMSETAGLYPLSEFNHPEAIISSIAPVSKQIADLQRYQQRTGIPIIERAAEAQARNDHGTSVAELKTELAAAIREVMGITVNVDNNGDMRRAFRLAQRQMRRDRDQVSAVRAGFTA